MKDYSSQQKILNTKKKFNTIINLIVKQQRQNRILKQNNPQIKNYEQLLYRY